jgi:site-specific DNA-methyltransferase (adenine-specific)
MKIENKTVLGDNLDIFKDIDSEFVDLVYIDPPFFTQKVQKKEKIEYNDKWYSFDVYLFYIKDRLDEIYRILKNSGSLFYHCDYRSSHDIKLVLDEIFGENNFRNEIIWNYPATSVQTKNFFVRSFDSIFFYTKSDNYCFNDDERIYMEYSESMKKRIKKDSKGYYYHRGGSWNGKKLSDKVYIDNLKGVFPRDVWTDIPFVRNNSKEYAKYPTQKPEKLLERIILSSSKENDMVMDCFCGSGTSVVVAKKLNRKYIGIDKNPKAIEITNNRLKKVIPINKNRFV